MSVRKPVASAACSVLERLRASVEITARDWGDNNDDDTVDCETCWGLSSMDR